MGRRKFGSLGDWATFEGARALPVAGDGPRPLRFEGVTEAASIYVHDDRGICLVFSGHGDFEVDIGIVGEGVVQVEGEGTTSIRIEGVKPRATGWRDGPSIADLEPKTFGTISPEVQAMFEQMQRNMLAREARLIEQLRKRD